MMRWEPRRRQVVGRLGHGVASIIPWCSDVKVNGQSWDVGHYCDNTKYRGLLCELQHGSQSKSPPYQPTWEAHLGRSQEPFLK